MVILPGDGIGPEIAAATREFLRLVNEKLSLNLTLETHEVGLEREGCTFPASVMTDCRAPGEGFSEVLVAGEPESRMEAIRRERGIPLRRIRPDRVERGGRKRPHACLAPARNPQ